MIDILEIKERYDTIRITIDILWVCSWLVVIYCVRDWEKNL